MLHGWEKLTEQEKELIAKGVADNRVYGGPFHAELSLTDNCNYDCFFCNQGFVDRSKSLSLDLLRKLIDEMADMGLKVTRLSGGGEPLLHPKIKDVLDHLRQHNITMDNVTTNGFMLIPPVVERLMALPTKEIIVSLNESDAERYAEMMRVRPGHFDRVVENMKQLMAARKQLGLHAPSVVAQFFVWKKNYHDVDRMVELTREIGADRVYLRSIFGLPQEQRLNQGEQARLKKLTETHIQREPQEFLAIDYTFENVFFEREPVGQPRRPCQGQRDRYCYIGWYSTTIRGNGDVFPCCMLQQVPDYPVLGNVKEKPFREIWLGEAYENFRRELRMIAIQRGEVREPNKLIHTKPICIAENECPLLHAMCDDGFYSDMNSQLERERRSLKQKLLRVFAGRT